MSDRFSLHTSPNALDAYAAVLDLERGTGICALDMAERVPICRPSKSFALAVLTLRYLLA
jgi:hypothetical protein